MTKTETRIFEQMILNRALGYYYLYTGECAPDNSVLEDALKELRSILATYDSLLGLSEK